MFSTESYLKGLLVSIMFIYMCLIAEPIKCTIPILV